MKKKQPSAGNEKKVIRCAIYTRKSTEEGLEQAFNSLDAQRESGEAYISAQRHEGWTCVPDRYDDGGFSGGTIERPALKRMLADIEAGKVDCVVVYKVDRLSRSLMDFARIMQVFESKQVSFVSVTQQFNTTHSMGRLTLNILLSFAQFEREIISERTRDKIAAARRKGKWCGGKPLLGYDIVSSPAGSKLIVNEEEAEQVRAIYQLYMEHEALIPTLKAVNQKGWTNKRWITKRGVEKGGKSFDKATLWKLLTNRTYAGIISYGGQDYPGEHAAIVDTGVWDRVRAILSRNGHTAGAPVRNRYGALLIGLVHCSCCRCAMVHSYTVRGKQGAKRYRYYVCLAAQKRGWDVCATKSVPAGQLEQFVVAQIKKIGQDPAVLRGTLRQMASQQQRAMAELGTREKMLTRELARHHTALRNLIAKREPDPTKLAMLNEQIRAAEQKQTELQEEKVRLEAERVEEAAVTAALTAFDPAWEQLSPKEQARVIRLLVERVEYDGRAGSIAITFRPTGIRSLAQEHEVAA